MKNKLMELIEENIKKGNKEIKIHTITTTGSGKYTQYTTDKTPKIVAFLKENNIKYTIGNDAPKGGKLGNYVTFKIDKRNKLIKQLIEKETKEQEKKRAKIEKTVKSFKNENFSRDEITEFLENYKESEKLYIFRKKHNISYREFRKILEA